MKQIAQYQDGRLELQEVPAPQIPWGGVLVKNTHSVISPGTEKMKVEQANMNLLQKAKARPDQVKKVLQSAILKVVPHQCVMKINCTPRLLNWWLMIIQKSNIQLYKTGIQVMKKVKAEFIIS